jgi:hypothetical protein
MAVFGFCSYIYISTFGGLPLGIARVRHIRLSTLLIWFSSPSVSSFWIRNLEIATNPSSVKHFLGTFTDYLEAVVNQAQHRDDNILFQSIEDSLRYRQETSASSLRSFHFT